MDTTTRITNAFMQTDDVETFRRTVMNILADDRLPAYRKQANKLASALDDIDDLRRSLRCLNDAINRSEMDIAPCRLCGEPIVCIPDGQPCCEKCAESEMKALAGGEA